MEHMTDMVPSWVGVGLERNHMPKLCEKTKLVLLLLQVKFFHDHLMLEIALNDPLDRRGDRLGRGLGRTGASRLIFTYDLREPIEPNDRDDEVVVAGDDIRIFFLIDGAVHIRFARTIEAVSQDPD